MKIKKNVCIVPCLLLLAFLLLVPMQVNASSKVKLSKKNVTLIISQKQKIKVKNVKNTKVKWKSSNTKIASVKKGVIVAKKKGKCIITATLKQNKKRKVLKCVVNVENPTLNVKSLSIRLDDTYTLKLNNTKQKVRWSSSNPSVVTVSNGVLFPKKAGASIIYARIGNFKYSCKVTVTDIGTRQHPISAKNEYTSNLYSGSEKLGNFTIKLLEYKSGDIANEYIKSNMMENEDFAFPKADEEYVYFKFSFRYNSGNSPVNLFGDLFRYYDNFYNSSLTMPLEYDFVAIDDGVDDLFTLGDIYPGANVICRDSFLIKKKNSPFSYRLQTGYNDENGDEIFTWFITE